MDKIRLLLADDHTIVREGLRALLRHFDDIDVVGEARDGAEAVARVSELRPDVVVMDIAMPGMNGIEATRLLHSQFPATKVLILTQYSDKHYVLSMMKAGACGYVLKDAQRDDLIRAIRAAARGEVFLQPSVSSDVVQTIHEDATPLTQREKEILQRIVKGETNVQIAETLSLSVKTVDWHRTNLMRKLNVHNLAELVRYAYEHGLTVADD
jgi:two-component system response regulator NreC